VDVPVRAKDADESAEHELETAFCACLRLERRQPGGWSPIMSFNSGTRVDHEPCHSAPGASKNAAAARYRQLDVVLAEKEGRTRLCETSAPGVE